MPAAGKRIGDPEWLRAMPRRWGLRQVDACRVMGIGVSTYRAKIAGDLPIDQRLISHILNVEMLLARGDMPDGWPLAKPLPVR